MKKEKEYRFSNEKEKEIGICIAIQKIGIASIPQIIQKIEKWGGKITQKQTEKSAENLRRRDLLSIDLTEKNQNGISIKRYCMKKIKLAIPEIAQIKDIVDDPNLKPLIEELDRSKKTKKKGLKTFDYYKAKVSFGIKGGIQGFIPDDKGIIKHYRNEKGEQIIFHSYHFKNWFRANLPLINRTSNSIGDLFFEQGTVIFNGTQKCGLIDKWVTNIDSGFSSSMGTGGRGAKKVEILPTDCKIVTAFKIPRDFIKPERFEEALNIMCQGKAFGGGSKLSTGHLIPEEITIDETVWKEE